MRSSALIGGSQVVVIVIGIVRTKAMAVILGPGGFGLMALFSSIIDFAASVASLGVDRSGVRQIAESVGSGDQDRVARTAIVLRRISALLGVVGAVLLLAASPFVSRLTFGTENYAAGVALLSVAVLCRVVAGGQAALIQGLRRISDLAMLGIVAALGGAVLSVLLVHALGEAGIAPSLVAVAVIGLLASWWYSRRVLAVAPKMATGVVRAEALPLVKLGLAFMVSGFLTLGAALAVRAMVTRLEGLESAGLLQAAWTVGGLYVGMVLQAMGADFYPRLTAVAENHPSVNRLVNEQTTVSLLLAVPGVVGTLVLAPLLVNVLYSNAFAEAADVLRWFCVGMMLRVMSWPIGYIIVAQGRQILFMLTDLAWVAVNLIASWTLLQIFGLIGAAIAYFVSYIFHWAMIYLVANRLTGFHWSSANISLGALSVLTTIAALIVELVFEPLLSLALGMMILAISVAFCARELLALVPKDRWPAPLVAFSVKFGRSSRP